MATDLKKLSRTPCTLQSNRVEQHWTHKAIRNARQPPEDERAKQSYRPLMVRRQGASSSGFAVPAKNRWRCNSRNLTIICPMQRNSRSLAAPGIGPRDFKAASHPTRDAGRRGPHELAFYEKSEAMRAPVWHATSWSSAPETPHGGVNLAMPPSAPPPGRMPITEARVAQQQAALHGPHWIRLMPTPHPSCWPVRSGEINKPGAKSAVIPPWLEITRQFVPQNAWYWKSWGRRQACAGSAPSLTYTTFCMGGVQGES